MRVRLAQRRPCRHRVWAIGLGASRRRDAKSRSRGGMIGLEACRIMAATTVFWPFGTCARALRSLVKIKTLEKQRRLAKQRLKELGQARNRAQIKRCGERDGGIDDTCAEPLNRLGQHNICRPARPNADRVRPGSHRGRQPRSSLGSGRSGPVGGILEHYEPISAKRPKSSLNWAGSDAARCLTPVDLGASERRESFVVAVEARIGPMMVASVSIRVTRAAPPALITARPVLDPAAEPALERRVPDCVSPRSHALVQ